MKELGTLPIPPAKENIGAIVVTYYPDDQLPKRIAQIVNQVEQVIIVDNGSKPQAREILKDLAAQNKIELIENENNRGIATALNQGVAWMIPRGYQWALTLDQDTVPSESMVETFIQVFDEFEEKDKIAVIGSNYYGLMDKPRYKFGMDTTSNHTYVEKKTVITSGSLMSISAYNKIGPFRDEFFIDRVDHEYCLRARSKGFKILMIRKPVMWHLIGAATSHKLLGITIDVEKHSAERHYFKARNHAILIREFFYKDLIWILKSIYATIRSIVLTCLFEEKKLLKVRQTIKGYLHGFMNNSFRDYENGKTGRTNRE